MGNRLKERILNLSDDDLLNLYEICYADYRAEALEYAKAEIIKRNIEKKVWFYNDHFREYGPYSRDEIIELVSSGDIKENYNIWYEGLDDWIGLGNINIFGRRTNNIEIIEEAELPNNSIRPPRVNLSIKSGTKEEQCLVCKGTGKRGWIYRYGENVGLMLVCYIAYGWFWHILDNGWKYLVIATGTLAAISFLAEKIKGTRGKCKNCKGTGKIVLKEIIEKS